MKYGIEILIGIAVAISLIGSMKLLFSMADSVFGDGSWTSALFVTPALFAVGFGLGALEKRLRAKAKN